MMENSMFFDFLNFVILRRRPSSEIRYVSIDSEYNHEVNMYCALFFLTFKTVTPSAVLIGFSFRVLNIGTYQWKSNIRSNLIVFSGTPNDWLQSSLIECRVLCTPDIYTSEFDLSYNDIFYELSTKSFG